MCAYYQDGTERIKKGDQALYMDRPITILEAKHLKATRTMRIVYRARQQTITLEVPYDTVMEGMQLHSREPKQPAQSHTPHPNTPGDDAPPPSRPEATPSSIVPPADATQSPHTSQAQTHDAKTQRPVSGATVKEPLSFRSGDFSPLNIVPFRGTLGLKSRLQKSSKGSSFAVSGAEKRNAMGSEVVEGYACKPVTLDPVRPIMHYRYHLYLCDDERCTAAAGEEDRAARLRALLKALHLHRGEHRIKISRSRCFGACRHRQVAQLNANTRAGANPQNNTLWLRRTHRWSEEQWRELFEALREDRAIETLVDPESIIEMEVF